MALSETLIRRWQAGPQAETLEELEARINRRFPPEEWIEIDGGMYRREHAEHMFICVICGTECGGFC